MSQVMWPPDIWCMGQSIPEQQVGNALALKAVTTPGRYAKAKAIIPTTAIHLRFMRTEVTLRQHIPPAIAIQSESLLTEMNLYAIGKADEAIYDCLTEVINWQVAAHIDVRVCGRSVTRTRGFCF